MSDPTCKNPFTKARRLFWKNDPEWKEFSNRLYEKMTFERALDLSTVKIWGTESKIDWEHEMKPAWLKLVQKWNAKRDIDSAGETMGFVALVYIFVTFPYEKLSSPLPITHQEATNIHFAAWYESVTLPRFKNMTDWDESGPLFPPAFTQWMDSRYDSVSWWLTYMAYEKRQGWEHVIDSPVAKKE